MKTRTCRHQACGKQFDVVTRGDNNRQYCTKECSNLSNAEKIRKWNNNNLTKERNREYRKRYVSKEGKSDAERNRRDRLEILAALGGACEVCGVTKTVWLHVDFKPTCRNMDFKRHPRHKKYMMENLDKFRVLCANHHYELTLTGTIEGTDITQ